MVSSGWHSYFLFSAASWSLSQCKTKGCYCAQNTDEAPACHLWLNCSGCLILVPVLHQGTWKEGGTDVASEAILTLFLFIHHALLQRYDFINTNVKAVSGRLGIFEWRQKGWLKGQKNCPVSRGEVQERLESLRSSTKFPSSIRALFLHFLGQLINTKVEGSKPWPCQSQGGKWRRWPGRGHRTADAGWAWVGWHQGGKRRGERPWMPRSANSG